jgi:rubrerythrin
MTTTEIDAKLGVAEARALVIATAKFNKAMIGLEYTLPPLTDDEFWSILAVYRKEVLSSIRAGRKSEASAHNLQCRMESRGEQKAALYMRFAKTYELKASKLYKPLFEVVEGRGDDGYGDLLDNLPLIGREVYEKALDGYYGNESALRDAVLESFKGTVKEAERLISYIFNGENYNQMSLNEKGREVFKWEMSPLECSDCNRSVSPVRGVDAEGKCPHCSLDGAFVEEAKRWVCY